MRLRSIILAASLACAACATPYQTDGFSGGQEPRWRDGAVLEVISGGNGYTSSSRLRRMTLLRAAEEAIKYDYRYFIELGSEDTGRSSTVDLPQTTTTTGSVTPNGNSLTYNSTTTTSVNSYDVYKPGENSTFRMFREPPPGMHPGQYYDAYEVFNQYGRRYIDNFEPLTPPA